MSEKAKHPDWDEDVKTTTSDRTNASGSNEVVCENPYRDKFLYVCRQLSEEHKYILRLETIIGNQRKELKRLNNLLSA